MIPTPTMPGAGFDENLYRGLAMAQLRTLRQEMDLGKLNVGQRCVEYSDGVKIYCKICFNIEEAWVTLPTTSQPVEEEVIVFTTGFILHPRSGSIQPFQYQEYTMDTLGMGVCVTTQHTTYGVPGGWEKGKTELTTKYIYPLVDTDYASLTILGSEDKSGPLDKLEHRFSQTGLYGNHYWTGDWSKEKQILSWKGQPSRHGRILNKYNLPGFSILERSTVTLTDEIPEYTVCGTSLYSGGNVLSLSPRFSWPSGSSDLDGRSLILGAMLGAEKTIYIVTQNDHTNAPAYICLFSNGVIKQGSSKDIATDYLSECNNVVPQPRPLVTIVKELELEKPGYYLGVWANKTSGVNAFRIDGWELLLEVRRGRDELPWFGNESGTAFVCSNGDSIEIVDSTSGDRRIMSATYTPAVSRPMGTYSETLPEVYSKSELTLLASATGQKFLYEYAGNTKVCGIASLSFSSVSNSRGGEWVTGETETGIYSPTGAEHVLTWYTDTSMDSWGVVVACSSYGPNLQPIDSPYDISDQLGFVSNSCIARDYLEYYAEAGHTVQLLVSHTPVTWGGDLPGFDHEIETDWIINVCGVNIPIVKTRRTWEDTRTPHTTDEPANGGWMKLWVKEDCVIETSTIHFLDQRYGVCLYKTVKDEIHLDFYDTEVCHLLGYGYLYHYNQATITEDVYTATSTETWHLVIDGIDTVIAETELPLVPFGEPRGQDVDFPGVCKLLVFPTPGGSLSPPVGSTEAIETLGCYEYGYSTVGGAESELMSLDGGKDHYYPEWCRGLGRDPFWEMARDRRYSLIWNDDVPYNPGGYTPPPVEVEPMPVGSFARHPILGDLYQFLLNKFNGERTVITSADITDAIDKRLSLAKNEDGTSKGLATHDTTVYYPISLL